MSTIIKAKRSSVQGKVPLTTDLELGEFAINTYDGKLYTKKNVNGTESIVDLSLGTTNLGYSANSSVVTITSDTGSDINVLAANNTAAGVLTATTQTIGGNKTFTGDILFDAVGGSEGGEIKLAASPTGGTLAGSVSIDINQNRLRIFENGGTNRGVYIDLTSAASSVGTNLLTAVTDVSTTANGSTVTVSSSTGADGVILAANSTTAGVITAEAQTIGGAKTFTSTVTADQFNAQNNGNGTNFKVGDDAWIGDINIANTIRITGLQDSNQGYLIFGSSNATALGRTGTGSLTYGGSAVILASDTDSASTASKIVIRDASQNFSANTITAALAGNATTATTLQTARTIGGVSFNGSADINLPGVNTTGNQNTTGSAATLTTARTISLGGDLSGSATFDGSANVTITATIAADSVALGTDTTGNYVASITNGSYITGGNGGSEGAALTLAVDAATAATASKVVARDASGNFSANTITAALAGNASTATALQTARTIGGVSFDGSANINLPGVNTTGNQNTTGSAATLTTARNINATSFNGSADITIPRVRAIDDRTVAPSDFSAVYTTFGFGSWNNNNTSPYSDYMVFRNYSDSTGGKDNMLALRKDALGMRLWQQDFGSSTAFATYKDIAWTDGTNATGTWSVNTTGSAATLTTARTIALSGDVAGSATFDGSANVTITTTVADDSHEHKRLSFQIDPSVAPDYALEYLNLQGTTTDTPTTDWWNVIRMGHGDPNTYYNNTLAMKMTGSGAGGLWGRTRTAGTAGSWFRFFDDNYHPNADTWTTARTITLGGDLTGSVSIDGSANVTLTATVAPNSVALGTDTTGDYVAGLTGGTGVTISGTAGEGWSPTVAIGQAVSTTSDVQFRDLILSGNLTVNGTTTTVNATNLAIEDNLIYLNEGSVIANPDIGIVGNYNDGTYAHTGVFRDATDGRWKFFKGYVPEPGQTIDTANATFQYADVQANTFYGALSGNATTATTLETARTIGGVSFDGSANINLPGVNTTGNQNTTGSAATLTTARTIAISGDVTGTATSFNGSANITISADITANTIVNADINTAAAIADTKLATISTAGKVLNSATTATDLNTASAIVARDASGNFTAGTITAALSGNATTATTLTTPAMIQGTDIPTAANLNNYTTPGFFHQNSNANAAAGTNYPTAVAGMLEVLADGVMVYQRYTLFNSGIIYTRSYYNGTWYAWRLVVDTSSTGTVTSTMIADGTIVNADINASAAIAVSKLAASTISGVTLGNNLNALTIGTGLSGTSYNGSSAVTVAIDSTVATLTGSQTLTNKTLTSPTINAGALSGTFTGSPLFSGTISANNMIVVDTGTGVYTDGFTLRSGTIAAGNPGLYLKKIGATAFNINGWNGTAVEGSLSLTFPSGITTSANSLTVGTSTYFVANGNVGIGNTAPTTKLDIYDATSSALTIRGDSSTYMRLERSSDDTSNPGIFFTKTRGTQAAKTAVASGDATGIVSFQAFGGTNNRTTAAIRGYVDTYVSDTNLSGSLRFYTTNASTSETEWMRITPTGNVGIGTTSPLGKLSVVTPANIAQWMIRASTDGLSNESGIYVDASNDIYFDGRRSTGVLGFSFRSNGTSFIRSGNSLVIGDTTARATLNSTGTSALTPTLQQIGTTENTSSIGLFNYSTNATSDPAISFNKSLNATIGSHTAVAIDTQLGGISWNGSSNTTTFATAATITASVDNSVGNGSVPGRIEFSVTDAGATTPTRRMKVDGSGLVLDEGSSINIISGTLSTGNIYGAGGVTITNGGVDIMTPGYGINFNVGAGSGSVTTATLHDYEEGTWTPVVADASSAGILATGTFYGHYTKVGRMVMATVSLVNITTTGMTAANDLFIRGLPYTASSKTGTVLFIGSVIMSGATVANNPSLALPDNTAYMRVSETTTALDYMTVSEFTSGTADIYGTITYEAA